MTKLNYLRIQSRKAAKRKLRQDPYVYGTKELKEEQRPQSMSGFLQAEGNTKESRVTACSRGQEGREIEITGRKLSTKLGK